MNKFIEIYFEDKKSELKPRTIEHKRSELKPRTIEHKKHVFNKHILPYFRNTKITDIEPKDLIKWQNC